MLTPGNSKLGRGKRIWGFGLPSRLTCPGKSEACEGPCYSSRLERFRPSVRERYRRNLALSRRRDFPGRVLSFLSARPIEVVRAHTAGDFYSAAYAQKWLAVMRRAPRTRFYFSTRSWRVPAINRVVAAMAELANVRVWYSCDRATGIPQGIPPNVRFPWLMSTPEDLPPRADLAFRVRRLRQVVQKHIPGLSGHPVLVCPIENGATGHRMTCEQCGICWKPLAAGRDGRMSLPIVPS